MAEDFSPGGRGFHLVEKVNRQVDEGKYTALEKGLQRFRNRLTNSMRASPPIPIIHRSSEACR